MSELWDFTRISVTQNNLQELFAGFDLGTSGYEEKS
ncbi:hypothetical protein Gotri_026491 [Gossypium trilobum]|uniref:Uncharacterized protein n=1 Tax=Gossypium trilobum TaxID=34281 RepID=A0A7J9FWJ9_9ROSI|nr:hypothetical protein [Gossypium trilobum]